MGRLQTDRRMAKEINLKEILGVLKKRAWIGITITILAALFGYFYSSINQTTLLYSSSTNIIINADGGQRKTLEVIIKDKTVLEKVITQLGIERTPESLAQSIQVGSIDETQVVKISVIDVNPELAAEIANTTANVFIQEIPNIMDFEDVRVLSDAQINPIPINESNENKILGAAIIGGIVIGIGLIFLVDSLDESIRSEQEVEELLEVPILGSVSIMSKKNINKTKKINVNNRGDSIGI
ncbi:YveK family protein [Robertmurraya korlensis]|uniref:YveK family protein n=1 Tax=Robertmurraya korlensis TaxID=519977 RepID=UPI0008266FB4|nr:Wzz/FepE/Etk N-terminal domain-containing protein [Robertmurraya korlensis]